jgi:hypothetical protein
VNIERIFLDETGNMELDDIRGSLLKQYFALTALCVDDNYYFGKVEDEVSRFKKAIFGTSDIYLHFHHLWKREEPFDGLSPADVDRIWTEICKFIGGLEVRFQTISIDKIKLVSKHPALMMDARRNAYEWALALHIERIVYEFRNWIRDRSPHKRAKLVAEELGNSTLMRDVQTQYLSMWNNLHEVHKEPLTPEMIQDIIPSRNLKFYGKRDKQCGLELVDMASNPLFYITLKEYGRCHKLRWREEEFWKYVSGRVESGLLGKFKGFGLKLF